ncbi:unnamed protein product [marine sediment metagenome]|uniref:Uncharacterized protein n=1 Tax=marine sediment metagenome TaxID=412755 RepID=X1SZ85_9ZZZZ
MSKKSTLILILAILLLGLNLFATDISYNLARDVAYHKAVSVFGNLISLGSGIPYYDIEDNLMGYEFGISLVGKFPDDSQIFAMVREKRLILIAIANSCWTFGILKTKPTPLQGSKWFQYQSSNLS